MVLPDSHGVPRVPHYSGATAQEATALSPSGALTLYGRLFQVRSARDEWLIELPGRGGPLPGRGPTTPRLLSTHAACNLWFRLFPVRSPLLRESLLYFLFLEVLRCFSSLGWPPHPMFVRVGGSSGMTLR